jgi:AcrR family transcriptional regulator
MGVTSTERPLRSDAAHNRELILQAASEAFAEHGRDACVEDIAKRAGVGVGTLYRRFPTKTALAEELGLSLLEHLHALAAEALETQPRGQAFETYVLALCGLRSKYGRALVWLYGMPSAAERVSELKALTARMIADGQQAGRLRADLDPNDLGLLMWSVQGVLETSRNVAPDAWRRLVETVFAGWRATGGAPLATPPLTDAESERITQLQRS